MSAQVKPKHLIAETANGHEVYANLIQSPLKEHISANPHLLTLVREIVAAENITKPTVMIEKDMGRNIGYSEVLEAKEGDVIFYARMMKTASYTKFVKNRRTVSTTILTIHLQKDENDDYELIDVWIGRNYPPTPDAENAAPDSKAFWDNHALVYNGQAIMASTVTKECPYDTAEATDAAE